jgi:hypothetical protein
LRTKFLVNTPILLKPRVLEEEFRAGSLGWIFVETLGEEIFEKVGASFGDWRGFFFDDSEHYYMKSLAGRGVML